MKETRQEVSQQSRTCLPCIAKSASRFVVLLIVTGFVVSVVIHPGVRAQGTLRLKSGFVNIQYPDFSFPSIVTGVSASAQWSVTQPSDLPKGMSLDSSGKLGGTPSESKNSMFVVEAREAGNVIFSLKVSLPIASPGVDPDKIKTISEVSFEPAPPAPPPICQPSPPNFVLAMATADKETIALTEEVDFSFNNIFNPVTLEINNINKLISATLERGPAAGGGGTDVGLRKGDYLVVHLVRWKPVKGDQEKSDSERELWALYENINLSDGSTKWIPHIDPNDPDKKNFDTRIFGSRRVALLMLHVQTPRSWDIRYSVSITQRTPQPIQDLLDMGSFLGGGGPGDCQPSPTKDVWGGRIVQFKHMASDMVVKLNTVTVSNSGQPVAQSKDYSNSYLNEGRYHWDVSFGLPVKSIKELEFSTSTDSKGSVVSVKKKERQNAYGFLNIFPKAVNLSGKSFLTSPHFLFGVPISGKPLDRPIIGIGTGLYTEKFKMNFFAGVAFNRVREPRTLKAGDAATANQLEEDLQTRRVRKFVFGINFPVRQFIDALKGK